VGKSDISKSGLILKSALILLGTVHSDPLGYGRTKAFLSDYRPDLILVEISPFALQYRKEHAVRLLGELLSNLRHAAQKAGIDFGQALRHSAIRAIARQLALPFEYRASAAYAAKFFATVVPVDWSEFSRRWIGTWPELISTANLEVLLRREDSQPSIAGRYEQAAARIGGDRSAIHVQVGKDLPAWQDRERHIEAEIRSNLARSGPRRPLYIGGWQHLVAGGEPRSLRELLEIGLSSCHLLDRGTIQGKT